MERILQPIVAVAVIAMAITGVAAAQEGKGKGSSQTTTSGAGWPLCQGMVWDGQQCRHPRTGKVCTVRVAMGGGEVVLMDCK